MRCGSYVIHRKIKMLCTGVPEVLMGDFVFPACWPHSVWRLLGHVVVSLLPPPVGADFGLYGLRRFQFFAKVLVCEHLGCIQGLSVRGNFVFIANE